MNVASKHKTTCTRSIEALSQRVKNKIVNTPAPRGHIHKREYVESRWGGLEKFVVRHWASEKARKFAGPGSAVIRCRQ